MSHTILGIGGFGAVVSPPLKIHKTKKKNYVSKITKKSKNFKNEFKISKKLQKIKYAEEHFCLTEDIKIIKHNDIPKNVVNKHNKLKDIDKDYISMIMPNCGISIVNDKSLKFMKNKSNFEGYIKHLLQSLKYLKHTKIVVGDIKLSNILINKTPILIDFGDSQVINKIYKNIHDLVCSPGYYSPELYLFDSVVYDEDNEKLKLKITHKDIITIIDNDLINKEYINEVSYEICNKEDYKTLKKLKDYYNLYKNKKFTENVLKNLKTEIIYKSDIYALGRVFEELNTTHKLNIKDKKILTLIQNMTEFNHIKRFSVEECIDFMN